MASLISDSLLTQCTVSLGISFLCKLVPGVQEVKKQWVTKRMEFLVSRSPVSYAEKAAEVSLLEDPVGSPGNEDIGDEEKTTFQEEEESRLQKCRKVLEGNPVISSEMLSVGISDTGRVVARGLLRCTQGKYKDVVEDQEFFTIMEGKATVEVVGGPTLTLEEGWVGELKEGSEVIYTVEKDMLKSFQLIMSEGSDSLEGGISVKHEDDIASEYYSVNAFTVRLREEQMQEGISWKGDPTPQIGRMVLSSLDDGKLLRGIWRCTTGTCTYVQHDQLFSVLAGNAVVSIENEETKISSEISLEKGMIGEFKRGDIATFNVEGDDNDYFLITFQTTINEN